MTRDLRFTAEGRAPCRCCCAHGRDHTAMRTHVRTHSASIYRSRCLFAAYVVPALSRYNQHHWTRARADARAVVRPARLSDNVARSSAHRTNDLLKRLWYNAFYGLLTTLAFRAPHHWRCDDATFAVPLRLCAWPALHVTGRTTRLFRCGLRLADVRLAFDSCLLILLGSVSHLWLSRSTGELSSLPLSATGGAAAIVWLWFISGFVVDVCVACRC